MKNNISVLLTGADVIYNKQNSTYFRGGFDRPQIAVTDWGLR